MDEEDRKLKQVIEHYRSLAAEALEAADAADTSPRFKLAYRKMARHWTELAQEIEECMNMPDATLN